MKTLVKSFKVVSLVLMTIVLANCAKSGGSSNNNNANNGYVWQNGQCYQNVNGQLIHQPNTNLCNTNNGIGNGYVWQNGQCYQNVNGQMIYQQNTALCNNGSNGGNIGQLCQGYYYDSTGRTALCTEGAVGITAQGNAIVLDCSGYTLYNQNSQIVTCQ